MSNVKRSRLSAVSAAVIVLGCSDAAEPADLGKMVRKAPPAAPKSVTCTSVQDFFTTPCQLSWYGVRFYGAIDVGAGYESNARGSRLIQAPALTISRGRVASAGSGPLRQMR
jgi:hypothetical protein